MSDENVVDQGRSAPVQFEGGSLSPDKEKVIVEGQPAGKQEVDPKSQASSEIPYHTAETEKIAVERANKLESEDKPYEYKVNGFTVTEEEQETLVPAGNLVNGKETEPIKNKVTLYKVAGDGGEKFFPTKREAEIFAETHAATVLGMDKNPTTMPVASA